MKKKSNWSRLSKQSATEGKYRDVYEDQQLERSTISELESPTSRYIMTAVAFVAMFLLIWLFCGLFHFGIDMVNGSVTDTSSGNPYIVDEEYYDSFDEISGLTGLQTYYFAIDENGERLNDDNYEDYQDVPHPAWYQALLDEAEALKQQHIAEGKDVVDYEEDGGLPLGEYIFNFNFMYFLISLAVSALTTSLLYQYLMRNLEAQNLMNDTTDINQYQNDQHIALPEEIQRKFDYFPDVGAHSSVMVSSMISHMALSNKGLNNIEMTRKATKDIVDEDGEIEFYKGELLTDEDGHYIYDSVPMMDKEFMEALFDASGLPHKDKKTGKVLRKYYDPNKIPYNPGNKNRDKLKGYDTVADMINGDWIFPEYEPQRPGGAYIVDTDPVNTMV